MPMMNNAMASVHAAVTKAFATVVRLTIVVVPTQKGVEVLPTDRFIPAGLRVAKNTIANFIEKANRQPIRSRCRVGKNHIRVVPGCRRRVGWRPGHIRPTNIRAVGPSPIPLSGVRLPGWRLPTARLPCGWVVPCGCCSIGPCARHCAVGKARTQTKMAAPARALGMYLKRWALWTTSGGLKINIT
jgi:hypothetical protein